MNKEKRTKATNLKRWLLHRSTLNSGVLLPVARACSMYFLMFRFRAFSWDTAGGQLGCSSPWRLGHHARPFVKKRKKRKSSRIFRWCRNCSSQQHRASPIFEWVSGVQQSFSTYHSVGSFFSFFPEFPSSTCARKEKRRKKKMKKRKCLKNSKIFLKRSDIKNPKSESESPKPGELF